MNAIFSPPGTPAGAPAGERLLADAIRRVRHSGQQRLLVLHLSTLSQPRPHHRRIARALLEDAASRNGGQVFPMRNGDLALLTAAEDSGEPARLAGIFAILFKADRPDPGGILSNWRVAQDQNRIFDYLQALRAHEPAPPLEEAVPPQPQSVENIAALLTTTRIGDLTQRQTAIEILPGGREFGTRGKSMRPLFREIGFAVEVLESSQGVAGRASSDAFLFRHLAARLDPRMMALMLDLLASQAEDTPRLHFNLTVETLLSDRFEDFARRCEPIARKPGIEVPLIEACRDPEQFAAARERVQSRGFPLVIEGVSPWALWLTNPFCFGADLVKLNWDRRLATRPHPDLLAAIGRLDPARIVIQHIESEQAIGFGLAHGITRFQGHYVDALMAAARLKSCPHAGGCSLRQCTERASAISAAPRRFCLNLPLLDRGLPPAAA